MSTWLSDLKERDPALAADYVLTGNQSTQSLQNMIYALEHCVPWLNTEEDWKRLEAAKRILAKRRKGNVL